MGGSRTFAFLLPFLATTVNSYRFQLSNRLLSTGLESTSTTEADLVENGSVFVGNLPIGASENEIKSFIQEKIGDTFSNFRLPIDRKSGQSRGFGYVDFATKAEAEAAIVSLTGAVCQDRPLKIDLAGKPKVDGERAPRRREAPAINNQENSIYIGNLDFEVTEEDIKSLCDNTLGEGQLVKVRIAIDKETGRPRGFAHVDFVSQEVAKRAVSEINQASIRNREIRVDFAQRKEDRPSTPRPAGGDRFAPRAPRTPEAHSVFIGNLAWEMTSELVEEMVTDILGSGLAKRVRLASDRETGRPKGFGHIDFKDAESAQRAINELNGMEVMGRQLRVDHAQRRVDNEGGGGGGGERSPRGGNRNEGRRYDNNESPDNYGSW